MTAYREKDEVAELRNELDRKSRELATLKKQVAKPKRQRIVFRKSNGEPLSWVRGHVVSFVVWAIAFGIAAIAAERVWYDRVTLTFCGLAALSATVAAYFWFQSLPREAE